MRKAHAARHRRRSASTRQAERARAIRLAREAEERRIDAEARKPMPWLWGMPIVPRPDPVLEVARREFLRQLGF